MTCLSCSLGLLNSLAVFGSTLMGVVEGPSPSRTLGDLLVDAVDLDCRLAFTLSDADPDRFVLDDTGFHFHCWTSGTVLVGTPGPKMANFCNTFRFSLLPLSISGLPVFSSAIESSTKTSTGYPKELYAGPEDPINLAGELVWSGPANTRKRFRRRPTLFFCCFLLSAVAFVLRLRNTTI